MNYEIQARYSFLLNLLPQLEDVARKYFRGRLVVENKEANNGFDPVTVADKEIESLFRAQLAQHFPNDNVVGEEFANVQGESPFVWTIDPIDGTRAFVVGSPTFTTLICLDVSGVSKIGVISQPFTGERFISHEGKAEWHHQGIFKDIETSRTNDLSNALMASTFPEIGTPLERAMFERVEKQVKLTRYGMDGYAYGLLAAGQVDLVIEACLKPFDYAAPRAVIQAAGGVVCGWDGNEIDATGRVLAAATRELADAAIALLQEN